MKKLLLTTLAALTILFAQAQQCQADFSYMQNGPTTIFTDLSTINSGWSTNYSVTWDWDLGDGNSSTQQNPIHTYASPGPNNGWYWSCLIVTYFDSTTINSCTSFYCDSIFVGNSIPASWDCNPTTGCYDPGTGNGQYVSLVACQAVCGTPTPSWDCDPVNGCYDPGTGIGQYVSLVDCQANCSSLPANYCDSMTLNGGGGSPQTILTAEVPISFMDIHYWITTAPDGTVLNEDSLWNTHQINNMNAGYDTLNICITYIDNNTFNTCCVTWIWDSNLGVWAKMGSITSIGEIDLFDKKLIKVVDVLGRETSINSNETLFFIYEDGTIEKRYIIDRK